MALADLNDHPSTQPYHWLTPRDLATITKDGSDRVAQWDSKGTSGASATQTTTSRKPLYVAPGSSNLGSGPAMRLAAGDDGMLWTWQPMSGLSHLGNSTATVTELRSTIDGVSINVSGLSAQAGQDILAMLAWNPTGGGRWYFNGVLAFTDPDAVTSTGSAIWLMRQDSGGGANFGRIFSASNSLFNSSSADATLWARGVDGDFGDMAMYDGVDITVDTYATGITTAEFVEGVILWAYGLEALLPAGHPYESAAPTIGATYTLTAAQGSCSLTGQAAALKAGRRMVAAQGSYTLAGQPVLLKAARKLAAGQGVYSLAGQATGLRASRRLVAAQGAYGLTGHAAGLTYTPVAGSTYTLAAAHGAYALAGFDIILSIGNRQFWTPVAATSETWTPAPPTPETWTAV